MTSLPRPLHCRHFGPCGGCQWLDVPLPEQTARRHALVDAALAPVVLAALPWREPVRPAGGQRFSRTRILYPFARRGAELLAGIYERGSHVLVDIHECQIQDEGLTELANRVRRVVARSGLSIYDETTGQGFLRALHLRMAPGTHQVLMVLVTRGGLFPEAEALAEALTEAARGVVSSQGRPIELAGIVRNLNDTPGNVQLGPRFVPLRGRDHVLDRADGLWFRISAGSFYQVHREAANLLYRPALALLGELAGKTVVDGFAGVGTFALRLARAGAARVVALEENATACADAAWNATRNGLAGQVAVVRGPVHDRLGACPRGALLLVDPPRAGLGDAGVRAALGIEPEALLYVSCEVRSFARDIGQLQKGGFRLDAIQLAELFPFTDRVELLARFVRR